MGGKNNSPDTGNPLSAADTARGANRGVKEAHGRAESKIGRPRKRGESTGNEKEGRAR